MIDFIEKYGPFPSAPELGPLPKVEEVTGGECARPKCVARVEALNATAYDNSVMVSVWTERWARLGAYVQDGGMHVVDEMVRLEKDVPLVDSMGAPLTKPGAKP